MRPHVVVLHRWRARYAEYGRYVDHDANAVTYVTTEVGASAVPPDAAEVRIVAATDDLWPVADQVGRLAERHGRPERIIALKEDDLLVAARLRRDWGCAGWTAEDLLPYRDKLLMADRVRAAGLALPAFAPAPDADAVRAFGNRHGWPVIVKPRIGSSSAHVTRVDDAAACDRLTGAGGPLLVQAFDPRPIHHLDGYFDGRSLGPWRASRYLNTCLGFRGGDVLGSVEEESAALGAFATRVLAALGDRPTMFHLEVFAERGECSFLEVGARVGGAEIPFLWREVHGYDLMEAAFRLGLGQPPRPWPKLGAETGGWLLVPAPAQRPCRITEATSMLGRTPGPYAEALLRPGEVLPAADAYYEHVGGRFRFRGPSTAAVRAAIEATARDVRVAAVPLGQPAASCMR